MRGTRKRLEEMQQHYRSTKVVEDLVAQVVQLETYPADQPIEVRTHQLDIWNYRLYYRIDHKKQVVRLLELRHRLEWDATY